MVMSGAGQGFGKQWTEDNLLRMTANPIYAGVPPYPAIVDDKKWIGAAVNTIKEVGAEKFLKLLLEELRKSMLAVQDDGK